MGHFTGHSMGARFYPVLYMLTRTAEARDWGTGLPLKAHLHGKHSRLEVHHIFPKAQLYKAGHQRSEVNAVANFCFQTKGTNLNISDKRPEVYFAEIEERHPGALASQWIPMDKALWRIEAYRDFLEARRGLLAAASNAQMAQLLHGDARWLEAAAPVGSEPPIMGGLSSDEEEAGLLRLQAWAAARGLSEGVLGLELSDPVTGRQQAVLDLAWPEGVRHELTQPVAVLIGETPDLLRFASARGFRCFTSPSAFQHYVVNEIESAAAA